MDATVTPVINDDVQFWLAPFIVQPLFDVQRQFKVHRLQQGGTPRVLDLFSGCGGISLGFQAAGFNIMGAVENDPIAALSHAKNFHGGDENFNIHSQTRDVTVTEPEQLIAELVPGQQLAQSVDVLVGGPPCQAFARVGRAKLREVAEHPEAFRQDARGNLYLRYLHYVAALKPLVILMENVPDVMNYGGHNIPHEMCDVLVNMGYTARYTLLNAAYYGVPQMRERMFLLAYAPELEATVDFPQPTHWLTLPKGYEGTRQVALRTVIPDLFNLNQAEFFVTPPLPAPNLTPAVTAHQAIGDLPAITQHLEGTMRRGARRFNEVTPYPANGPISQYAYMMRNWPRFENTIGVADHVIRSLPRDYAIFRRMNPGDQYPQAYNHALDLFNEELVRRADGGNPIQIGSQGYQQLKQQMVPPYDVGKFPNKWRKMAENQPVRTLMAHLGKDGYSHIHYDSRQARTISVREAARLQSFPDGFVFSGTMNPAFRQIGNAVPPLLARRIAENIWRNIM
ncbi:MAG: DNA cytosine methyltransferase [Chloroflexota bacterium]|nr:DNA cytosine methyltransferase [Chloroflexota bacterium]